MPIGSLQWYSDLRRTLITFCFACSKCYDTMMPAGFSRIKFKILSNVIIHCLTFRQGLGPTDWKGSLQSPSSKEYRNRSQWCGNTSIRAEESGCPSVHFLDIISLTCVCMNFCMKRDKVSYNLAFSPLVPSQLRCGNPKVLKRSQIYPRGYGKAVCEYHRKFMELWLNLF